MIVTKFESLMILKVRMQIKNFESVGYIEGSSF
jgi:hypothetical protein